MINERYIMFICDDLEFDTLELAISYSNYLYEKFGYIVAVERKGV